MRKLFALGIILGLAACNGADDGEFEDLDTDIELQEPAPPATMPADTMQRDTLMEPGTDTMGIDSPAAGAPRP